MFKDAGKDSRTTRYFSRSKDITSFDSKFKDSPWRSRTSGNQWGNWRGEQGCAPPPTGKMQNMGPLLACISVISILLILITFCFWCFSKIFRSVFRWFRLLVQTNPVNRITNFPRFFIYLTGICDYPYQTHIGQVCRLTTQGPKIQPRGHFVGLATPNKTSTLELKCETLEISVVFSNLCSALSCNL